MQLAPDYNKEKMLHGCEHYKRRCKLHAPCCNELFTCHHCHNKYTSSLNDLNIRHKMVLKDVTQVECLLCNTKQQDCGICRLHGRENFYHCQNCGCCLSVELRGFHVCSENAIKNDCPICHEYLFDSVKPMAAMYCGHIVHLGCYSKMRRKNQPPCLICSKSSFSRQVSEILFIVLLIYVLAIY
ncbi:putative transcription factor C2H2 family [Helianthus annuus]|nr:putative transcription factor C2H2 family [Helianthus annuus]KAJ0936951.1 putative transcription factor C2H2 family [Helianthus annuus]